MKQTLFKNVPIDSHFVYMGKHYQKTSYSHARDSHGELRLFSDYSTVFWHDNVSTSQPITAEQSLGQTP